MAEAMSWHIYSRSILSTLRIAIVRDEKGIGIHKCMVASTELATEHSCR